MSAFTHALSAPTIALVALLGLFVGCTQPPPPGSEDDAGDTDEDTGEEGSDESGTDEADAGTDDGTDTGPGVGADSLYPLADGATWVYIDKNLQGQLLGEEIVEATEIEWEGQQAWLLEDSPNANGEWTEAVIIRDGDLTLRVHKDEIGPNGTFAKVDYDPGFPRANDAWDTVDQLEEHLYERTEYDGNGQNPDVEPRGHSYKVLGVDVPVTVPAGTFDCVEVERIRTVGTNAGERVVFWYARGVGKVREERLAESKVEELASVDIPGGASYP